MGQIIEKEIKTVTKLVEYHLSTDERCRNDDKWLIYKVFRNFTNIYIPFEDFNKMPSFDSVRRVRQKTQANGDFLPTSPEVIKRRRSREKYFKEWAIHE